MVNVDVNRSIQFVSLDTHPANNALVVTYEILASVVDSSSQRELDRRNKRHQIQVKLSVLDKLSEKDLRADQLALDLGKLSAEILTKCPLLTSAAGFSPVRRSNLEEEIQLHLLYLIGRRRTQLLAPRSGSSAGHSGSRPPSALTRLRSAGSQQKQQQHASNRRSTSSASNQRVSGSSSADFLAATDTMAATDVYGHLLATETPGTSSNDLMFASYMDQLDERLDRLESSMKLPIVAPSASAAAATGRIKLEEELDVQLEGLYGDRAERLTSMAIIRQFSKRDENLAHMASNKLLICALLRTLRDSEMREQHLSESILYCLIWLTTYHDLYKLSFATEKDPIQLERIVAELLVDHVKSLKSLSLVGDGGEHKLIEETYYYTNSLLSIMVNLIRLERTISGGLVLTIRRQASQQQQASGERNFVESLVDLLHLLAKHLARCIRFMAKLETTLIQLTNLVIILRQLSLYKDFICQLYPVQAQFVDTLINLLNTLQLSRPGSGGGGGGSQASSNSSSNQQQQQLVTDKQTLKQLYLLEMDLLRLVNNLVFDQRLKLRFIRRNLLKCILRNLVVLLASTGGQHSNTLKPYQNSSVLIVPFKCLYELSCHELVKAELYKSKIIIKCLLEFLLSATMDLKQSLELSSCCLSSHRQQSQGGIAMAAAAAASNQLATKPTKTGAIGGGGKQQLRAPGRSSLAITEPGLEDDQIVLEPNCAAHYILSLWANLSSKAEATIYGNSEPDLIALVCEYVHLNLANLRTFLELVRAATTTSGDQPAPLGYDNGLENEHDNQDHDRLMVYLHSKVLRNLSQYLRLAEMNLPHLAAEWAQQLASTIINLPSRPEDLTSPLSIESLATLSNLLGTSASATGHQQQAGGTIKGDKTSSGMMMDCCQLIGRLFQLDCGNFSAENDDFLLVSSLLIGNLARKCEICNSDGKLLLSHNDDNNNNNNIGIKMIETSNFILDSRTTTDYEMILSCLYALIQLMNHSSFLKELARHLDTPNGQLERLVGKLQGFVLNCSGLNLMVPKLSILILNNLRQLEQQLSIESLVYNCRFSTYNNKWLSAIRASGEDLMHQRAANNTGERLTGDHWPLDDAYDDNDDDEVVDYESGSVNDDDDGDEDDGCMLGDPSQLRALESGSGSQSSISRGVRKSATAAAGSLEPEEGEANYDYDDYDEDDDDYDDDDDEENDDGFAAPDLNVIDSNSMIKHLTSRRELRHSAKPMPPMENNG